MITLILAAALAAGPTNAQLQEEVRQTEIAFAKTMADRDLKGFESFLAEETVWFGGARVLRGKAAVVEAWKRFYEGKEAPFSWRPEKVEVLDSGTLGLSTGPVHDPSGKLTNTYQSIWRRKADGKWEIIFDKGSPVCDPPVAAPAAAPAPAPAASPKVKP